MMKRYIFALSFVLLFATIKSSAQNQTLVVEGGTLIDGTGRAPVKDAVIVVEGNRIKQVNTKGKVTIPPNAKVVNAEGKTISRAQSLDDTKKSKLTRSEVSEMKVRMINADVAIVTGVWTGAGTDAKGQKFDTSERWTDVFANQGGKWKCVASQNSTIKK